MDRLTIDWGRYRQAIRHAEPQIHSGKVQRVVGLTVEASGPQARLGDQCRIFSTDGGSTVEAEVVGFKDDKLLAEAGCSRWAGCAGSPWDAGLSGASWTVWGTPWMRESRPCPRRITP